MSCPPQSTVIWAYVSYRECAVRRAFGGSGPGGEPPRGFEVAQPAGQCLVAQLQVDDGTDFPEMGHGLRLINTLPPVAITAFSAWRPAQTVPSRGQPVDAVLGDQLPEQGTFDPE